MYFPIGSIIYIYLRYEHQSKKVVYYKMGEIFLYFVLITYVRYVRLLYYRTFARMGNTAFPKGKLLQYTQCFKNICQKCKGR